MAVRSAMDRFTAQLLQQYTDRFEVPSEIAVAAGAIYCFAHSVQMLLKNPKNPSCKPVILASFSTLVLFGSVMRLAEKHFDHMCCSQPQ